jgi:hypothetical protein
VTPVATTLLTTLWPGLCLWVALYLSDYSFTLKCARLYQAGVNRRIVFEGSYELTPYFQNDIDSLRVVSPRFVAALFVTVAWLALVWWLSMQSVPAIYPFCLGLLISVQLALHIRHLRNLFLFRAIVNTETVQGRIEYPRPLTLRISAVELFAFSGLFGVLFFFTQSWFVLGGAIGCLSVALKHWRLAQRHTASCSSQGKREMAEVSVRL